jgi:hypothetical protein
MTQLVPFDRERKKEKYGETQRGLILKLCDTSVQLCVIF